MRLVDADAVVKEQRRIMETLYGGSIETIKEHMDIDDDLSVPLHALEGYSRGKQLYLGLKGILEASQAVSATPPVRCKDCRHSYEDIDGLVCGYGVCVDCIVRRDFFCADGEKMGASGVEEMANEERRSS